MLSKKRWRFGLAFLSLLICLGFLLTKTPLDDKPNDIPILDADPTRNFTTEAIAGYLDETYGDNADQMWQVWGNDKEWATMITNARPRDTLALIAPDGSVSWYYFDGDDILEGIHESPGPGPLILGRMSGRAVEEIREKYALIGGLFRQSNDTISLGWYPSGIQEGKHGYSGRVSGIDIHRMTLVEYGFWKIATILTLAGAVAIVGWIVGGAGGALIGIAIGILVGSRMEVTPLGPLIISLTVDLYDSSQTQIYYDYQRYQIFSVGKPIDMGHIWTHTVKGPCPDWMPCFFGNLYILNTYVLTYISLNLIIYALKKSYHSILTS